MMPPVFSLQMSDSSAFPFRVRLPVQPLAGRERCSRSVADRGGELSDLLAAAVAGDKDPRRLRAAVLSRCGIALPAKEKLLLSSPFLWKTLYAVKGKLTGR